MKIVFFVSTPAQAHFFKNIIRTLEKKGHNVKTLARNYGETLYLLKTFNISHFVFADTLRSKYGKIFLLPYHIFSAYRYLRKFDIDLIVGTGLYSEYASFLLRRPNIIFMDAVSTKTELHLIKGFTSAILSPSNLTTEIGEKHIKINSFKEISYLHPRYFGPDKNTLNLIGMGERDNFAVIRFNAFDAIHDVGVRGFSPKDRRKLINELSQHGKILISSETSVPQDLEEYVLKIPKEKIHDVLYYAKILIADTGTMVTEAALLGTPAILYHPKAKTIGNFIELEQKYNLIYTFDRSQGLVEKALSLFTQRDLKKEWEEKRERVIKEKIDMTLFMVWFIENFPESIKRMKEEPAYQETFA
jgi:predicted glycosyltransferase